MKPLASEIKERIEQVNYRIDRAAQLAGRSGKDVSLVVVTKGQPVEIIRAAIQAGARFLGENYPEETVPKIQALGAVEGVSWHMIGHLQSRKTGLVVMHFDVFQSLDSLRLASRLDQQLRTANRVLPVMLEFNVSGEESKYGWQAWDEKSWPQLLLEIEGVLALPNLSVQGLMTMPPYSLDPQKNRPYFARLRKLRDFLAAHFPQSPFRDLSMGTSNSRRSDTGENW